MKQVPFLFICATLKNWTDLCRVVVRRRAWFDVNGMKLTDLTSIFNFSFSEFRSFGCFLPSPSLSDPWLCSCSACVSGRERSSPDLQGEHYTFLEASVDRSMICKPRLFI